MIALLALRNLTHRPWRSAFLFLGYGIGVGVMVVLLAIGEALISQARDEKLVGGGELTVLPDGLDVEVMKTGGVGGMWFSIDHARFVYRQLLAAPRLADDVRAAAPQIEMKLLYLRTRAGRELPVRAGGEIPSRTRAVGAMPALVAGAWEDDERDRRWIAPTPAELRHEVDAFHLPPASVSAADRGSWGEWHYFNILSADGKRWAFISFIVGGAVPDGRWGGQVAVTLREQGAGGGDAPDGVTRRFGENLPARAVRFSTSDADVRMGSSGVTVLPDGRYRVRVAGAGVRDASGTVLTADLTVTPAPYAYFPGASLGGEALASGYAVPALRASATGTICAGGSCQRFDGAQAYHDHNWGLWRGVTWDWGAARAGAYTLLYGRMRAPDATESAPLVLYLVDSLGFRAVFRPPAIDYVDGRAIVVGGRTVRVPSRAVMTDARGADTIRVALDVDDAIGTDMRRSFLERGGAGAARRLTTPYFIQMKGTARLTGRIGGVVVRGTGAGFFETYR